MKPLPHRYEARLTGGPSGYADLAAPGLPALQTAPPPAYDGPGDAWSPEHLLLAAVQACFLFTFRAVARMATLEFVSLELDAAGTVDRQDGITRFVDIVLRPTVIVPADVDAARVLAAVEKAKKACLVSSSLSTPIRLETDVRISRAAPVLRAAG